MQDTNTEVVGDLTAEENTLMEGYQRRVNELIFELGSMEIRRQGLLKEVDRVEDQAGAMLRTVGERLGLGKDEVFKVVKGQVVVFRQPSIIQSP